MEATAVSLTRTVLDGVLGSAGTAMADEAALLLGVRREVGFIRSELQMMQSFLRVQSSATRWGAGGSRDTVRTCVKQVRDLACDLEDCLLDFTLHASRPRWLRWGPGLVARHRVAGRIRGLKATVVDLNQRNQRYNVFAATADSHHGADLVRELKAIVVELNQRNQQHNVPAEEGQHGHADDECACAQLSPGDEGQDIERVEETKHLADLVKGGGGARVVSVWGMGGMGKSSLVRMLYNDRDFIDGFDGRAWFTVPHPLESADELERQLRKQLVVEPRRTDGTDTIQEWLEAKRCLVVVDDVASPEEWDLISRCLAANGTAGTGSRVIVTTRRNDVALRCAGDVKGVYELKPLDDKEARKLLYQKVYKKAECMMTKDMVEQASRILERCRGLPLAIATIGGLLANRPKTSREWMDLRQHLGSELESDRDIKRVITSSYDGLPYHLKCCFLYLSIFPENHEIRLTRLLRRWIAEGYITKPRDMSVEELGRRYYNELISRSMIQPSEKARASMAVERCRVHGVVLQIILSQSIEENQLFIMDKHCNEAPPSKIRHLVVTRWKENEKMASLNLSQVRSLTIFGRCPVSLISSKLRLLRVLDLEDTLELENDDLKHIGELHHLRYLGLRKTNISSIPSSLENLRFLETLDVQDTKVIQLPVGITKLEKLCHLVGGVNFTKDLAGKTRKNKEVCKCNGDPFETFADLVTGCYGYKQVEPSCSCCSYEFSVTTPERIEKLRNLQVLGVVHIARGSKVARNLGELTSLRRLGVEVDATDEVGKDLCNSISKLVRLERLEVRSRSLEFLKEAKKEEEMPPKHLLSLRLCGRLGNLPSWMDRLNDLAKVKLIQTQLKQVDIEVLGKLPNLTLLALWEESFSEKTLCFGEGTFPKLKVLYIEGMENIESIQIKDGALPVLEKLEVMRCINLDDSKEGLSLVLVLKNLNELVLTSCGDKPKLEEELQKQIRGFKKRPKFITGKSIVSRS
nr:NBS-LRR disease resistance protein [Dasypyrum villosum]